VRGRGGGARAVSFFGVVDTCGGRVGIVAARRGKIRRARGGGGGVGLGVGRAAAWGRPRRRAASAQRPRRSAVLRVYGGRRRQIFASHRPPVSSAVSRGGFSAPLRACWVVRPQSLSNKTGC
jgi:hypothetical protein